MTALLAGGASDSRGSPAAAKPQQASVFVSPTGSDANSCRRAAPCVSFDRAYRAAKPGQVVEVAAGTYPGQTVTYLPGRDSATAVVFRTAGAVTIQGNLELRASGLSLKGSVSGSITSWRSRGYSTRVTGSTSVEGDSPSQYPRNVTIEGVDGAGFGVYSSANVTVRDVDIGPVLLDWDGVNCTVPENKIGPNGRAYPAIPRNVVYERVVIHEINRTLAAADADCHNGGLFIISGDGITIRRSVFSQNVVYNIQLQNFGDNPPPNNVLLENNWFGCPVENAYVPNGTTTCNGQPDLQFNSNAAWQNFLIRFNSLAGGITRGSFTGSSYANFRVLGNTGSGPSQCFPGAVYAYNAWVRGQRCSTTERSLPAPPFVNTEPGQEDFNLKPGTKALGIVVGEGRDYDLASDIEGRMRPLRAGRDAGAAQRESARIVLGRSIGTARLSMKRSDIVAFYGRPRRTSVRAGVRSDVYRSHGATLRVVYRDDQVIEVGTTSSYYTTEAGFGPESPASDARRLMRARWDDCREVFRRRGGSGVLYATPNKAETKIVEVSVLKRSDEQACTKNGKNRPGG